MCKAFSEMSSLKYYISVEYNIHEVLKTKEAILNHTTTPIVLYTTYANSYPRET